MNTKFENRLSMFRTVQALFEKNAAAISTAPKLQANVQLFKILIEKIDLEAQRQALKRTGIAKDKQNSRLRLADFSSTVSDIIQAYGAESSTLELYENANYSRSALQHMRDSDLIEAASIISSMANNLGALLDPYGSSPALLTDLAAALDDFILRAPSPALAYSERTNSTLQLKNLFTEANLLLSRKIDNNMSIFNNIDPSFLATYRNARLVHDYPAGRRKETIELPEESFIMGTITDTEGNPIEDALITLKPRDIKMQEITLEVAADSEYYIESVPLGFWDMVVSKEGYLDTRIENFEVTKDDELTMDITLQPIADEDDNEEDT